jgi:hypothetical protein
VVNISAEIWWQPSERYQLATGSSVLQQVGHSSLHYSVIEFATGLCTAVTSRVTSRVFFYLPTFTFICLAIIDDSYLSFQKLIIIYNSRWRVLNMRQCLAPNMTQYPVFDYQYLTLRNRCHTTVWTSLLQKKNSVAVNDACVLTPLFYVWSRCHLA